MLEELGAFFEVALVDGLHLSDKLLGLLRVAPKLVEFLDKSDHHAVFVQSIVSVDISVPLQALKLTRDVAYQLVVQRRNLLFLDLLTDQVSQTFIGIYNDCFILMAAL